VKLLPGQAEEMMDQDMILERKGKLLIVADDPVARLTLDALLARKGYETRCTPDERRTLAFAEADPPELILLDVRLPDVDAYEACRQLKKSEKTALIPVVFLSGLDEAEPKIKGFEAGGVDYTFQVWTTCLRRPR
jgi:PleD family two-component response regulator